MRTGISKSYDAYEQVAHPSAGAANPAGKDSANNTDTLKARHITEKVRDAVEVKGAAKTALDKQLGRNGDKLGDATTHPASGCNCCDSE